MRRCRFSVCASSAHDDDGDMGAEAVPHGDWHLRKECAGGDESGSSGTIRRICTTWGDVGVYCFGLYNKRAPRITTPRAFYHTTMLWLHYCTDARQRREKIILGHLRGDGNVACVSGVTELFLTRSSHQCLQHVSERVLPCLPAFRPTRSATMTAPWIWAAAQRHTGRTQAVRFHRLDVSLLRPDLCFGHFSSSPRPTP